MQVSALDVRHIVDQQIKEYSHIVPTPDSTIGEPWSKTKIDAGIFALKAAFVRPYQKIFRNLDTPESPYEQKYWIVADGGEFYVIYDPVGKEFGLALKSGDDQPPETIGVRGDLVSVFLAW